VVAGCASYSSATSGQEFTLTSTSTVPTCRYGPDHSAIVQDLQERDGRLRHAVTYHWRYNTKEQAQQHLREQAAYPKGSPWRYNDVTSGEVDGV
jgi:hypothetical protein